MSELLWLCFDMNDKMDIKAIHLIFNDKHTCDYYINAQYSVISNGVRFDLEKSITTDIRKTEYRQTCIEITYTGSIVCYNDLTNKQIYYCDNETLVKKLISDIKYLGFAPYYQAVVFVCCVASHATFTKSKTLKIYLPNDKISNYNYTPPILITAALANIVVKGNVYHIYSSAGTLVFDFSDLLIIKTPKYQISISEKYMCDYIRECLNVGEFC